MNTPNFESYSTIDLVRALKRQERHVIYHHRCERQAEACCKALQTELERRAARAEVAFPSTGERSEHERGAQVAFPI
jgi:hypothetical protein